MSKHFCLCLPVRFGVFVLSFLTFLTSAGTAALLWFLLIRGPQLGFNVQGGFKTGLIIAGVVWTVFALVGLLGNIGAIIRNRALVRTFSVFLWAQFLIGLAVGIAFAVALFKDDFRSTLINECADRLDQLQNAALPATSVALQPKQVFLDQCSSIFYGSRLGFSISYSISLLINLYACFIVHRYGLQLTEEQQYRGSSHAMGQTYAARDAPQGHYPHTPMSTVPGRQGHYEYPYAQKEHGFGGNSH